jgi:hypothetical protein
LIHQKDPDETSSRWLRMRSGLAGLGPHVISGVEEKQGQS